MLKKTILLLCSLAAVFIYSCQKDPINPEPEPNSTWQIIQSRIWDAQCVVCHTKGASFATQSNLILDPEVAYEQLVDRVPNNEAARNDGLLLVGTKGLEDLAKSFLWEKINAADQEHFYDDHPEYGGLMPLSGRVLTNGELAFIRKWILEAAPKTGMVADVSLLEDSSRYQVPDPVFTALPEPTQGFQLHLGPFDVAPQSEREMFYYQPLNNSEDIYISRLEIRLKKGSHHFILYDFPAGVSTPTPQLIRDLYTPQGGFHIGTIASIADQRFVFGTQWREMDYQFPAGVALKIAPNSGFDLNPHYLNRTNETNTGEVYVNIHTVDKNEVQYVAQNLFLNNRNFRLPAGKLTTVERTYKFNERRHIFMLTSHAHQQMTEFRIYISGGPRDGELIFFTNDWEHPPLLTYDDPIILEAGQGLKGVATYHNTTNRDLQFGVFSEDEMMIIFGAYYTD